MEPKPVGRSRGRARGVPGAEKPPQAAQSAYGRRAAGGPPASAAPPAELAPLSHPGIPSVNPIHHPPCNIHPLSS